MDSLVFSLSIPILAVVIDTILGDPHNFPHPVRFIGNGLDLFEGFVRKSHINKYLSGWIALVLFSGSTWAVVQLLIAIPGLGYLFALYFAYSGLALGCLLKESRKVEALLNREKLDSARQALAMLVSRDTSQLDEDGIRRTLAETVSENLNDGFVAPIFYLTLLGPGGMWAYKVVSTMDSMWGYKTERYRELGYAGAKTDDALAFIPARLTAWLLILVGRVQGLQYDLARRKYAHDARQMESPNAGWPMSAAAWLAGAEMGGPTVYFGKVKDKPVLGPKGKSWDKIKITTLLNLIQKTGYCSAGVCILGVALPGWVL